MLRAFFLTSLLACIPGRSFAQDEEEQPLEPPAEKSSPQEGGESGSQGEEAQPAQPPAEEEGASGAPGTEEDPGTKSEGQMIIGEDKLKDSDQSELFDVRKEEPAAEEPKVEEEKPKPAKKEKAVKKKKAPRKAEAEAAAEPKDVPPGKGAPPKPKAKKRMEPFPILPLTPVTPENP